MRIRNKKKIKNRRKRRRSKKDILYKRVLFVKLGRDTEKIKKRIQIKHNKSKLSMGLIKKCFLQNKRISLMNNYTKLISLCFLNLSLIMYFQTSIWKYTNTQSQTSKKTGKKISKMISANTIKTKWLMSKLRKSRILICIKISCKEQMRLWIIRNYKNSWNRENSSKIDKSSKKSKMKKRKLSRTFWTASFNSRIMQL